MQNWFSKILTITVLSVIFLSVAEAQTSSYRLKTADSLFEANQYTQSFEHYKAILDNKEYTPAMLLKMAFIQEGLQHVGQALYYLNLYYRTTNDVSVLRKMEELAAKHHLKGYETSDGDEVFTWYYEHHTDISLGFVYLCLMLLGVAAYQRYKLHTRPVVTVVFLVLGLIQLLVHLQFHDKYPTGIIADPHTYIMDGPSAGADVVAIVDGGHRLRVLGEKDVWLMVKWDEHEAYIKKNHILPVKL